MLALRLDSVRSGCRVRITPLRHYALSSRRAFAGSLIQHKKHDQRDELPKEKPGRLSAGKTSLRRVSLEAERSRVVIRDRHGRRFVDPDVETKKVTAYCAAEQYDIHHASRLLKVEGYELDPCHTCLYPQVIHVQTPILPPDHSAPVLRDRHWRDTEHQQERGDVFVFPSGTVVTWNVPERTALRLVERLLPPAAMNSHSGTVELEKEDLEYIEDPVQERSAIYGDTIILGTKAEGGNEADPFAAEHHPSPEVDTVLAKIAFSSGLARSTKLAVLERLTDAYFASTRSIPTIMSRGTPLPFNRSWVLRRMGEILGLDSRLPFSRSFILRKTGELLSIRAQLNLYSELTDSLPDLFWDSKHELGLEGYYDHVGKALDVGVRIQVLNEKMDYAQEIASVLRETLSERHNLRLEWGIIVLIAIEVVFELIRQIREYRERHGEDSVLLRTWLEKNGTKVVRDS